MKKLLVRYRAWGENWPLGELADNGDDLLFEYSKEALSEALELSPLRLPLRPEAYGDNPRHLFRLPGLISDALPDGWGLLLMDRYFRRLGLEPSNLSPLDRLAFLGRFVYVPGGEYRGPPGVLDVSALDPTTGALTTVSSNDDLSSAVPTSLTIVPIQ